MSALVSLLLTACAVDETAPVINKAPFREIPPETVVRKGSSIYMIAWEFGLDFQDIAEWNGIEEPYRLQEGQRLRLREGAGPLPAVVETAPVTDAPPPKPAGPLPQPAAPPVPTPSATAEAAPPPEAELPATPPTDWLWPTQGDLIARFSRDKGINGIQIAGSAGAPVLASAGGEVVYVGEGLRGYGKLVIVKHSRNHLSAYAHNRKILVVEGDRVGRGQQIAEMGSTGADRTMLHFEIRVNGKPQDPLRFLKS